jgi:hypothetical protein
MDKGDSVGYDVMEDKLVLMMNGFSVVANTL